MITAFLDDAIVGHIIIDNLGFERANHRPKIVMGVLKKCQNKGLGSQLLQYAIDNSDKLNILALELQVKSFNMPAIRLYEKYNFTQIGCIQAAAYIDNKYHDELVCQRLSPALKKVLDHQQLKNEDVHKMGSQSF